MQSLVLVSFHKNHWRVCTSDYILTHSQKPNAYISSSPLRVRLLSLSRWHNSCFLHWFNEFRDSKKKKRTSGMKNSTFVNPCDNSVFVSCSSKVQMISLLQCHSITYTQDDDENHVSSCQSKNVLWWVEWSRLRKNGDFFYSHFWRWIVHVFCTRMFFVASDTISNIILDYFSFFQGFIYQCVSILSFYVNNYPKIESKLLRIRFRYESLILFVFSIHNW